MVGYGPPPGVADRIARFCETPAHHLYQPDEGIPALRAAISEKLARENGIDPAGREIMVTAGANMGILNALLAITDPGDEVILPRPYFFNHEMAIRRPGRCRESCRAARTTSSTSARSRPPSAPAPGR